jgi:hypothetical protein
MHDSLQYDTTKVPENETQEHGILMRYSLLGRLYGLMQIEGESSQAEHRRLLRRFLGRRHEHFLRGN